MRSRKNDEVTPEIQAWRALCPIRQWLDSDPAKSRERLKRMKERFGRTKASIYNWMWGIALPTAAQFPAICRMAGTSPAAYVRWFKNYPPDLEEETAPCLTATADADDEDSD